MLNTNLIRNQILMISEPGELAGAVIRSVVAEAERHAQECFTKKSANSVQVDLSPIRDARAILSGLINQRAGGD